MKKRSRKEMSAAQEKADRVMTHLSQHAEIDSSDVTIDVGKNGVTLKGTVDNNAARGVAENIVTGEVEDVGDVINDLKPKRDISEDPADHH